MYSSGSIRDRNFETLVRDGITAAKNGNLRLAWSLLNQATQMNSYDPRPWLWLTETTDDLAEKCEYLERAVAADPYNAAARRALAILKGKLNPGEEIIERGAQVAVQPSDEPIAATAKEIFLCLKCGGRVEFDILSNQLTCLYCGYTPTTGEERSAADAEHSLYQVLPTESGHRWAASQQQLSCQRCGAVSLWQPEQKAVECPYCASHQLIASEETAALIDPQAIAVMQISEEQAVRRTQEWFGRGWFVPDDLSKAVKKHILHPAYYPFWTFDGVLELHWSCEINEGSSDAASWVRRSGVETELFNDTLIPGLQRLKFEAMKKLGPYNLMDMVEFKPQYLAGWPALTYDRPLAKASLLARERVVKNLRQQLYDRVAPGRQKRGLKAGGVNWLDMTFKYVLLPLWIGTYHYQGKSYQVYVNGQTGKVSGEKPRDLLKTILIITSAVLSFLVVLIFLALAGLQMGWLSAP
jgi:DNA-directed RNA polymerase subunit RPC12/RpoP